MMLFWAENEYPNRRLTSPMTWCIWKKKGKKDNRLTDTKMCNYEHKKASTVKAHISIYVTESLNRI